MKINIQLFGNSEISEEDIKGKYADSLKEIEKLKEDYSSLSKKYAEEKTARATAEKQRDEMFFRLPLVKERLEDEEKPKKTFDEAITDLLKGDKK